MKEKNSKRYINKKIEEFFSNKKNPKQFSVKKISIKKSFLGIGIFLSLGWIVYLGLSLSQTSHKKISITSINLAWIWENSSGIISTPLITQINEKKDLQVILADLAGNIMAIQMYNPYRLFSFDLNDRVISPLSKIFLPGINQETILAIRESGKFVIINKKGHYLYQSRDEFINQPIQNKALFLAAKSNQSKIKELYHPSDQANLFLVGKFGSIWGMNSGYGQVVWENETSPLNGKTILASPILINQSKKKIFSISEEGTSALFNSENGFLIWSLKLNSGAKSTPLRFPLSGINSLSKKENIFVLATEGDYFLISEAGKITTQGKLADSFVSSPNLINLNNPKNSNQKEIVAASTTGKVYLFSLNSKQSFQVKEIFSPSLPPDNSKDEFISSPVVVDFNLDEVEDILLVSRNGQVIIIDGKTLAPMLEPFYLFSNPINNSRGSYPKSLANRSLISASPLVGDLDGDGNLEIVIASEDGKVFFLSLLTNPSNAFEKNVILQGEFLKNSFNNNNL